MHQKFIAKLVVLEAQIEENREKNVSPNHVFFVCVFSGFLERFGDGFGKLFGRLLVGAPRHTPSHSVTLRHTPSHSVTLLG